MSVDTRIHRSPAPEAPAPRREEIAPELVSAFLRQHRAEIIAAWEAAVRAHPGTRDAGGPVLRDVLPELLDELAARPHDARERGAPPPGADLAQVIAEYLLVRSSIARLFAQFAGASPQLDALRCIDDAIDGAVTRFTDQLARQLRDASEHRAERLRFLAEATAALGSSLNYDETLQRVAELAVPVLADWCVVDLVGELAGDLAGDGAALRRVSVAHRDPEKLQLVREWARRYPTDWVASRGVSEVIRTGEPELVGEIPDEILVGAARDSADLDALRALGLRSYLIVPLVARDRRLGAITLVSAGSGRRYGAADVELARELARRAAMAVDNARLYFEAQRAIRAREQILAIVSHDLRNPLTAISMFASMLHTAERDPQASEQLERILRSADRMKRLINDMLDTSAIQTGRLALQRVSTDLAPVIIDAVEAQRVLAEEKQIALAHQIRGGLRVSCDPGRIAQVLGNLIDNALKFCRPGDSIHVTLSQVTLSQEPHDHAEITVADTGPGIPADVLPHVFEPYWTTLRDPSKGSGLGLYICKGIIDAHGGRIRVASRAGEGTRISFTLPLEPPR